MQVVILAAGRGSRLGETAGGLPKCLLPVGGRPIIEHQLDAVAEAGPGPVLAVTGHAAPLVRARMGSRIDTLHNPRFASTNSLYSLWLARHWIEGPVLILNCDTLFDPDLPSRLAAAGPDSLAYDASSGQEPEHMKVRVRNRSVTDISKTLDPRLSSGENVGAVYLAEASARAVLAHAGRIIADGRTTTFWAEALRAAIHAGEVAPEAVDVADLPWIEIDYPEDLAAARGRVWPAIRARARAAERGRLLAAG